MQVDRFLVCELQSGKLTAQAETQGCGCHSMQMIGQLILVGQSKSMNSTQIKIWFKPSLWSLWSEKTISRIDYST